MSEQFGNLQNRTAQQGPPRRGGRRWLWVCVCVPQGRPMLSGRIHPPIDCHHTFANNTYTIFSRT